MTDTVNPPSTAALVVKMRLRPGAEASFSAWHAKMSLAPSDALGFVNAEVNAPAPGESEWRITQRFRTVNEVKAWRASECYSRLVQEAYALADGADGAGLREDEIIDGLGGGVVTEVVTTYVKGGKDQEYREWASKIHQAEAQFPGYRGSYLQPPPSVGQRYWTTLVRFAKPAELDVWLNSSIRRELLSKHHELVQSWEHHRLPSSFSGWFPADPATKESPKGWKQSMLVLLMLFPIVMLEIRFLSPLLRGASASPATFVGNAVSVSLLAWPFMPLVIRPMKWWLLPGSSRSKWINPLGLALLLGLYAMEIVLLARLV